MSGAIAATTAVAAGASGLASAWGSKKAADAQEKTADSQLQYMQQAENQAREDIGELYPQALEAQQMGLGRQLEMQRASAMPAAQAMQRGNFGAQQVLSGSMPQYQNAIMGNQVDYGFAQPQQFSLQGLQDVLARGRDLSPYQPNQDVADQYLQQSPEAQNLAIEAPFLMGQKDDQQVRDFAKRMRQMTMQYRDRLSGGSNGTA